MAKAKINPTAAKIVDDAEIVEEALLENRFAQAIISFLIASAVYFAEIYLYSIDINLAVIGFLVTLAVVFHAIRTVWKPKRKSQRQKR